MSKPEAAVVWGKIIVWISKKDYYELKIEYYDETGSLINKQFGTAIKKFGARTLPSKFTMIPMDKEGYKTIFETKDAIFDKTIPNRFFSIQNMKKVR